MDDFAKEYTIPNEASLVASSDSSIKLTKLNLDGHSCTNCNTVLLKQLKSNPFIDPNSINLEVLGQIQFMHEDMDLESLLESIEELGYRAEVLSTQTIVTNEYDRYAALEEELNLEGVESCLKKMSSDSKRKLVDLSGTFHPNHLTLKSRSGENKFNYSQKEENSSTSVELSQVAQLKVSGMTCSACVHTIESSLMNRKGILKVNIQLLLGRATVEFLASQIGIRQILLAVEDMGYGCELVVDTKSGNAYLLEKFEVERIKLWFQFLLGLIFVLPSFAIDMVIGMFLPRDTKAYQTLFVYPFLVDGLTVGALISSIIATGAFLVLGAPFLRRAYKSLRYTRSVNMDSLISLGALTAYATSLTLVCTNIGHKSMGDDMVMTSFEVIPFLFTFLLLGKYLETVSKQKTLQFITNLLSLSKAVARRILDNGDEEELDIQLVQVDDLLRVNVGEKIPCDGILIQGTTTVDESMLTGEFNPVTKTYLNQDQLIGGSINLTSSVVMKVSRVGPNTVLNQIVTLSQNAQASKADIEILADKLASRFAPGVILFAIATILVWLTLGWTNNLNLEWLPHGYTPTTFAIFNGVSTLIIACPCALGLASPTAVMVGTGLAAKYGLIVRGGGKSLEMARRINVVVFDKTGTLTQGQPIITNVKLHSNSEESLDSDCDVPDETNFWRCVVELENRSNHPIAKAITNYATAALTLSADQTSVQPQIKLVGFEEIAGMGVVGKLLVEKSKDSDVYELPLLIGSSNLLKKFKVKVGKGFKETVESWSYAGKSVAYVATYNQSGKGKVLATLAAEDAIRSQASSTITSLKSQGIEVWMLTGDKLQPAKQLGKTLGIDNVIAGVLPNEKGERVKWLQSLNPKVSKRKWWSSHKMERNLVAMVGDGINDSVALAQADLGVAMGQGTDLALNTADCILLRSQLTDLLTLLQISSATYHRIQFNFGWAFGYNLCALPLAAGLTYPIFGRGLPPALAGILMVLSSLSVMISSILLGVTFKPKVEKNSSEAKKVPERSWDRLQVPPFAFKSKEKWRLRTLANNLKVDFNYRELS